MKTSQLLGTTLKESPGGADLISHDLMIRAGYIRQLSAGIFSYLHLGQRSLQKIEKILREEMERIGGVEIAMPVVHPAEIWKKTGRYEAIDESLARFQDRNERDMVLAMTHEEVVSSLAQSELTTYKQLPLLVYQIQTKFRDEARPRGGLVRVKEFTMKDSYSLDRDWEGLEKQYKAHYEAYFRIFTRAGLPVEAIKSDVGMMGGKVAHEFMYISDIGEDTIFISDKTGYKANKEVATFHKVFTEAEALPLEKIHTPSTKTIKELAEFLNVKEADCAKVVFFTGTFGEEEKVVMALVRGDMEVNPIKVQKLCKAEKLRPSTEEEIKTIGSVAGYASPIGVDRKKTLVIVDDYVANTNNLVAGANELDYHLKNVCHSRDFTADSIGDLVMAFDGAPSPDGEDETATLRSVRGVEVGNIFQLGTKYTEGLNAFFMDEDGTSKPIIMGSYGIGVGRMLACIAEEYHDENGLCLPITVAPFQVMLVSLADSEETINIANELYAQIRQAGIEVLYDDRKIKSAGVKFKDADLRGIPLRVTVSKRALAKGGVEFKKRTEKSFEIVSTENLILTLENTINELIQEIDSKLANIPAWKDGV